MTDLEHLVVWIPILGDRLRIVVQITPDLTGAARDRYLIEAAAAAASAMARRFKLDEVAGGDADRR